MTEHMKEAERLADEYAKAVHDGRDSDCVTLRAALLAHIQRGVPDGMPCEIVEADFSQKTVTVEMKCDRYEVRAGLHYLVPAAAAPDQFRDAAKMMAAPAAPAEVKLYAWRPSGHGQYSFYVTSTSEEAARTAVQADVDDLRKIGLDYETNGWDTDYYSMEVVGLNEVMTNDNS